MHLRCHDTSVLQASEFVHASAFPFLKATASDPQPQCLYFPMLSRSDYEMPQKKERETTAVLGTNHLRVK
jgi:hypothetical protein